MSASGPLQVLIGKQVTEHTETPQVCKDTASVLITELNLNLLTYRDGKHGS